VSVRVFAAVWPMYGMSAPICISWVCEYVATCAGYTKLYRTIPWDVYRGMELP
jgi:hypothetical protein